MKRTLVIFLVACGGGPKKPVAELENPATCMECHNQHYTEWSGSMHAYASDDPVFVAMNNRGQRETQGQLGTFCVQCHAPMAVALGLTDGTNFDPNQLPDGARGITCFFCHNVESVKDDHNNGLQIALDDNMRGGVKDPVDTPAHNSSYDAKLMASDANNSVMCGSCHDVTTPRGVALERTYQEWQTTVFTMPDPFGLPPLTCSGCHMTTKVDPPTTVIADKPGLDVKSRPDSFHEHMWPGIDQALTDFPQLAEQANVIARDLDGAIAVIGPAPPGSNIGPGGICVNPGNGGQITVRMDSRGTGHMWPSGAAQDRRAWLEVHAFDASNKELFSSGVVPAGKDPEQIGDSNLVGFWDRTFKDGGMPAHFFWEVATVQSNLIRPPVTLDRNSPAFDHSTTAKFLIGPTWIQLDHISVVVHIRPVAFEVLDDLVATKDLDPAIASKMKTLDIKSTIRHWTKVASDPTTGCDPNPFM